MEVSVTLQSVACSEAMLFVFDSVQLDSLLPLHSFSNLGLAALTLGRSCPETMSFTPDLASFDLSLPPKSVA